MQKFINRDPLQERGGINLYAYCGNDPIDLYDPSGTKIPCWLWRFLINLVGDDEDQALNPKSPDYQPYYAMLANPIPPPMSEEQLLAQGSDAMTLAMLGYGDGSTAFPPEPSTRDLMLMGLLPMLPELLGGEAVAAEAEGSQTLYRGVWDDHPSFDDALEGNVNPRGGTATAAEHNEGNTQSIFTSWTTDPALAAERASSGGVVLEQTFPASRLVASPDVFGESEVLVTGPVTGAKVTPIP